MRSRPLTANVPTDLADKVDEMASRLERPADWIVKQALSAWIGREEREHRMVLEGLADVDAGRVVDDEDVQKWLESFDGNDPLPMPQPC